jgi:diguanylate cyclase (GGDEF)-like protein
MSAAEIAIWSGSLGIFAVCFAIALLNAAFTRSIAGVHAAIFILAAGFFVWSCSGLLATFMPYVPAQVARILVLISGPAAASVATIGLMQFLRTRQRDAIVQRGLIVALCLGLASMAAVWWPDGLQALESVAVAVTICALLAFWLVLRTALLGDRFAWAMAGACVAMLVAVMSLYAVALHVIDNNLVLQAVGSAAAASYLVGCAVAVWQRNAEYLRMRRALSMHREKDLLTQLWTGAGLIKRVDQTIARAHRNRKETVIICVEIFNAQQLRQELGHNGVEQVIFSIAARMRHSVGASTEVGRYDDTSFVVILEGTKNLGALRTLGFRLASAVRRPYLLNPNSTSPREFRADMGIGMARLPAGREALNSRQHRSGTADTSYSFDSMGVAQEAMHDASELAKQARNFASRTAIVDAYTRKIVALENADLR